MPSFIASIQVTYDCCVGVTADTEEEARDKFNKGDWDFVDRDGKMDWSDPEDIELNE